jgi:hypothetical protein
MGACRKWQAALLGSSLPSSQLQPLLLTTLCTLGPGQMEGILGQASTEVAWLPAPQGISTLVMPAPFGQLTSGAWQHVLHHPSMQHLRGSSRVHVLWWHLGSKQCWYSGMRTLIRTGRSRR